MFNVGDIITGIPDNPYGVTTSAATMEVVGVLDRGGINIRVRVIDHEYRKHEIGGTFNVNSKYFRLISKDDLSVWRGEGIRSPIKEMDKKQLIVALGELYSQGEKHPQRNKVISIEKALDKLLKEAT